MQLRYNVALATFSEKDEVQWSADEKSLRSIKIEFRSRDKVCKLKIHGQPKFLPIISAGLVSLQS
jgi:hypothetical protein